MSRWLTRGLLALLAVAFVATASISTVAAADPARVPASKLTERPFRGITLVAVGDNVVCTGFVVAPRKVVTAAHCLTRNASSGNYKLRRGLPGNIRLLRAYSQAAGGSPFKPCRASKVWAHSKFVKRDKADRQFGSRAHDYAVITTARGCSYPKNAVMRMWATKASDGRLSAGQTTRMAGYPADPRYPGMNGLNLWRTNGKLRSVSDPRMINTTGFVAQGMSGAPVWHSYSRKSPCGRAQCVIGVLTECEVNARDLCKNGDSVRRAVRITPTVKKILKNR